MPLWYGNADQRRSHCNAVTDAHPTAWSDSHPLTDVHTRYTHCDALVDALGDAVTHA